jgi:hypothetical protein
MTVSSGGQIAEHLSIGVLAKAYPRARIRAILERGKHQSQRIRDLPAEVVVYYVIALGLFMAVSTGEVLRCLIEGLRWIGAGGRLRVAGKSGISQARTRLGAEPLKTLWEETADPIASTASKGAFYRSWRLVAIDGSSLDVPDTAENLAHFGKQSASRGEAAFPQLRFVAIVECGPHVLLGAAMGGYRDSEDALAQAVLPRLRPGMLCLGDRLYATYPLWSKALTTGAQLLWRARNNALLPIEHELDDGSYLSTIYPSPKARQHRQGGIRVRVIDYKLEGIEDAQPFYRLLTTLLDPAEAPALELAALYPQRWEIEGIFDELKTHLRGRQVVLRSKTPVLIEQEFYGLLLAHRAVRTLMNEAAEKEKIDPDALSFTHALRVIRRKLATTPALSP